jgi:hypothetical protein
VRGASEWQLGEVGEGKRRASLVGECASPDRGDLEIDDLWRRQMLASESCTRAVATGVMRPPRSRSAAAHQASDCGHHLGGASVLLARLGPDHTRVRVAVKQSEGDLVERGLDRRDLGEDIDAVTVLLDHPLDPADLALDAREPAKQLILRSGVTACWRCRRLCHVAIIPPPPMGMVASMPWRTFLK